MNTVARAKVSESHGSRMKEKKPLTTSTKPEHASSAQGDLAEEVAGAADGPPSPWKETTVQRHPEPPACSMSN